MERVEPLEEEVSVVRYCDVMSIAIYSALRIHEYGGKEVGLRLRRVGVQVDFLNLQNVVCWVAAEVQRVVARHLVLLLDGDLVAAHP
jgi:hypothetical protein